MYTKLIIHFILFQNIFSLSFLLQKGEERCIIDEFLEDNYFVVKYKIFTENKDNINDLLPFISLNIKEVDTDEMLFYHSLTAPKSKFSHTVKITGLYKICIYVKTNAPHKMKEKKIFANLKITSDNMEKFDLTNAIKSNDVERMENKADSIIGLLGQANEIKKSQINTEKDYSFEILSNAKMYKYLNIIQIVVSGIIGLVQLNNFRRFLKSKHVV